MNKHTPGPWYVDIEYPIQIMKHMEHLVGTSKCTEYVVADISEGAFMGEEELANARLIAAAPEMFEALQELLAWDLDSLPGEVSLGYSGIEKDIALAKAAISKATGE